MPLSENKQTNETAGNLVKTLKGAFGTPPGYRVAHARGRIASGTFTPTSEAASLSKAQHFHNETPVIVRFSSSTGIPNIPDTDPNSMPRGIAVQFVLSNDGHKHTDIIAHSTPHFPTRTGEGFLSMLQAIGNGTIGKFLEDTPSAAAFVQELKPFPVSFGTEKSYGLNAFEFLSEEGKSTFVRYLIVPVMGLQTLSDAAIKDKSDSYLFDELADRLAKEPIEFKYVAQIAEEGDPTDDVTKHWPEERKQVTLGTIKLDKIETQPESLGHEKKIIFDPIPRVDGIKPSDDPLLDMRATVYIIGGKERRAAPEVKEVNGVKGVKANVDDAALEAA
ncbi:hypothetical protein LTR27_007659 [Elasticomyces elasticus]|nr:hypothetical protein LTR27_007659 [Elasticomyces elasticus]